LIKAANTQRDDREAQVRWFALESIAALAENVRNADPGAKFEHPQLEPTLLSAATDKEPLVRKRAAFVMGVVGGDRLLEALRGLLTDSYPDVRYNAATGLARYGDPAAIEVLVEMLDPAETAGLEIEEQKEAREQKRQKIVSNALRAARQLHAKNPSADIGSIETAIEKLLSSKPARSVQVEAAQALQELRSGVATASASE